ncbi:MAG: CHAT domain-containing protein, partial [Pseudanabaena sp.]
LKQDRILEAQQVLDLLKVEELNEYLRTPTRSEKTEQGTELRTQEKTFIALALELDELQKRKLANNITAAEQERLNKLVKSEQEQQNQFIAFLDSDPVQKLVDELRLKEKQQNVDITNNFQNLRTDILNKYPNAVLLYPLILEDRLELILITAKTTPIRRTINIKREKLNQEITNFLAGLRDPSSQDIQKPAQQMYTWLIKPFETELAELKIDTIIYAPDGQLRYIPLAALYDGKQWLVEKYRVNNITAASLTKFNKPPIATPKIFAGAFGNVNKQGFSGLPATLSEVKKIADRFPNTATFIETAFTKELTTTNSNSYTILHLATHGQLSTGDPKDSFILFGDGEKATITDIRKWALTNVDLVVLSACQSGLGSKLGNGVEILGLGYQIQAAGARMSIATLWKVSDVGTEKLMDAFYTAVKTGKVSNVEALRQAQVAMITGNYDGLGETRGIVSIEARPRSTSSTAPTKISHPYYWAAFILIGNGL